MEEKPFDLVEFLTTLPFTTYMDMRAKHVPEKGWSANPSVQIPALGINLSSNGYLDQEDSEAFLDFELSVRGAVQKVYPVVEEYAEKILSQPDNVRKFKGVLFVGASPYYVIASMLPREEWKVSSVQHVESSNRMSDSVLAFPSKREYIKRFTLDLLCDKNRLRGQIVNILEDYHEEVNG